MRSSRSSRSIARRRKTNRIVFAGYSAISKRFIANLWVVAPDWAKAHPDIVKKFVAVNHEANVWANKNHDQSAVMLAKYSNIPVETINAMARGHYGEEMTPAILQPGSTRPQVQWLQGVPGVRAAPAPLTREVASASIELINKAATISAMPINSVAPGASCSCSHARSTVTTGVSSDATPAPVAERRSMMKNHSQNATAVPGSRCRPAPRGTPA